jgi:hypothetical protein
VEFGCGKGSAMMRRRGGKEGREEERNKREKICIQIGKEK